MRILEETPVPVVPLAVNGLWGSFISHAYGPAMRKLPSRIWAKLRIIAGNAVSPEAASPELLRDAVVALHTAHP